MRTIGDHAVVLGASMGGLLAARVLADAYQRVTVVDRDLLPERAADRQGVPQGRHIVTSTGQVLAANRHRSHTVAALPASIHGIRMAGYQIVPVCAG
jgi:2-polyprenyl-6-methoxyphenol hydroxylase-like FAD-dependent oxidoreductase